LANVASEVGVNLLDVRPLFKGHGVCSDSEPWINGLSIASESGSCTWSVLGKCIIHPLTVSNSFHPNPSGHSGGYAVAFKNFLDSPAANSLPGPQASSLASPSRPAAVVAAAVVVNTLTVEPVISGTAACAGTYQAGQQVLVSGDGFAPGASVLLYVTSPGLLPANEQQVGQLTADSSGHVAGTIRIPPSATGFTPSGSLAGLVFINALGLGPDGAHVDDTAMLGLAPHTSSCGAVDPYIQYLPAISQHAK
jgi:hypothetical protein